MLLGWAGFSLFKNFLNPKAGVQTKTESGQKMVACSVCDTHVPESAAVIKNSKTFCSKEHSEK
tara:strand:- start:200 stop:388 length:189 start_codon:yes stop_codon:yes gene_type:complete